MNKLELLQEEIQTLTLEKDVLAETIPLQQEVHNLKNDLRNMGSLYDSESFRIDIALVLKAVLTAIVVVGGVLFDGLDKFLNWMDDLNKQN